jgi:hypothetical protein
LQVHALQHLLAAVGFMYLMQRDHGPVDTTQEPTWQAGELVLVK